MGTSDLCFKSVCGRLDHPHACGDKETVKKSGYKNAGSSPRVWGQEVIAAAGLAGAGIIPTRVGTRYRQEDIYQRREDHPHACGDKVNTAGTTLKDQGSSPRVWGQVDKYSYRRRKTGIIPTRVGTRVYHTLPYNYAWDHPHACGDKSGVASGTWSL